MSMPVDHPDIEKFIDYKSTPNRRNKRLLSEYKRNLRNAKLKDDGHQYFQVLEKTLQDDQLSHVNVSVSITDDFMDAVKEDKDFHMVSRKTSLPVKKIKARKLFRKIAEKAWDSGDPGILLYDSMNKDNMVKYLGNIETTNPCITGDSLIATVYFGNVKIRDLAEKGEDVLVYTWNPQTKLPEVSMMRNIHMTRESAELMEITFDSGLKVKCTPDHNFYSYSGYKVMAKDLEINRAVRAFSTSIHRDGHLRAHGWVAGKTRHKYVARMIWEYFNGPIEGDLILHHKDFDKLNNKLENFELLTNSMHNLVHYPHRRDGGFFHRNHKIVDIKYLDEKESVYNGTVDNTHSYIIADPEPVSGNMSGIVSANCGEVNLLPYESCCLSSINLLKILTENNQLDLEFLEFVVRRTIRFLDDIQEITEVPLDEINKWCRGLRRIGLGVFGWADVLATLKLPYDSDDALRLANLLSWFINYIGWDESINLAKERGPFPFYDPNKVDLHVVDKVLNSPYSKHFNVTYDMDEIRKTGLRNVSITAIAPTGSIALLADVNSGIEPFFALYYKRNITQGVGNTAKDHIIEINKYLLDYVKQIGFSDEEIEKLKEHLASGKSLETFESPKIPDSGKAAFRTSHEVKPEDHVKMQAAWQEYITNSISKTINLKHDATIEDIENVFILGWALGLKGLTVYRDGSKTFQILNVGHK